MDLSGYSKTSTKRAAAIKIKLAGHSKLCVRQFRRTLQQENGCSFFKTKKAKRSGDGDRDGNELEQQPATSTSTDERPDTEAEADAEEQEDELLPSPPVSHGTQTLPAAPAGVTSYTENKAATDAEKMATINQNAPSVESLPLINTRGDSSQAGASHAPD